MEPGQHPQRVAAFAEEPALQPGLDAPPHRLGGQDGADGHDHGHPAVAHCHELAREGGQYGEVHPDEEGGERDRQAAVHDHASYHQADVVEVVLQHRDRDRDHYGSRP